MYEGNLLLDEPASERGMHMVRPAHGQKSFRKKCQYLLISVEEISALTHQEKD
jgi:hypothetical protein